jgi:hypothetical protein
VTRVRRQDTAVCPPLYDNRRQKVAVIKQAHEQQFSPGDQLMVLCRQGFMVGGDSGKFINNTIFSSFPPTVWRVRSLASTASGHPRWRCVDRVSGRPSTHAYAAESCTLPLRAHSFYLYTDTIMQQGETLAHGRDVQMFCLRGYAPTGNVHLRCELGEWRGDPAAECRPSKHSVNDCVLQLCSQL